MIRVIVLSSSFFLISIAFAQPAPRQQVPAGKKPSQQTRPHELDFSAEKKMVLETLSLRIATFESVIKNIRNAKSCATAATSSEALDACRVHLQDVQSKLGISGGLGQEQQRGEGHVRPPLLPPQQSSGTGRADVLDVRGTPKNDRPTAPSAPK